MVRVSKSLAREKYERQKELARERQRRRKEKFTEEQKEAKRKYDRERVARLRAEKKIKSIGDMTSREQRKQRKYWRERNKVRSIKLKAANAVITYTPPQSPNPDEPEQRRRGRKKVRKEKAKAYRKIRKQEEEIKTLKKRIDKYKKRLEREKKKIQNLASPSPQKQVKDVLGKEKVSPAVKRQLFLGFVLKKQVESQRKTLVGSKKRNQIMQKYIGNKLFKKYRVQNQFTTILPYRANKVLNDDSLEYSRKKKHCIMQELSNNLTKFYEDDNNSKMCPGKKDFVKKGSRKKQRRVLLHPLQELHKDFVRESKCKISFTTFTRARPFWVSLPKKSDRETCACVKHANMELLVTALKQSKVIQERNPREVLKSIVCTSEKEDCMTGKCKTCKNKSIAFSYDSDFTMKYFKWKNVEEDKVIKNKTKTVKRTMKVKVVKKVSKVEADFKKELKIFKKHVHFSKHQIGAINKKTENIASDELVFRIDFSENYVTKLASEIQSYHFGASKRQLSLNTGVRYARDGENVKTFCFATVSDNIDHQAHAIWAHMNPILQKSADEFPHTKAIHFFSDSPSNQYRNRYNIHCLKTLVPKYFKNLNSMTWNYTEAGHGKGPMDGVGGTLKRLADRKVSYGVDITCAKDFVKALDECKICLLEVPSSDIEQRKAELTSLKIAPLPGIMKVHQFTFVEGNMCDARELTCFQCPPSKACTHYGLSGVFQPARLQTSAKQSSKKPSRPQSSSQKVQRLPKEKSLLHFQAGPSKKQKLTIEAVFTSSENEDDEDQPMKKQDFDEEHLNDTPCENVKSGDYILVQYTSVKKKIYSENFIGICQSDVTTNNEVDVIFMKPCKKDNTLYFLNESDRAPVFLTQIKAVLPQPKIILKGKRVFYKFLKL